MPDLSILRGAAVLAAATMCSQVFAQVLPMPGGQEYVRGTLQSIDAKSIAVATPNSVVKLPIVTPLSIYQAKATTLAAVKATSFIGVTSVKQADGSEMATEIHIFPEALRGLGEGSHMMDDTPGTPTKSRMTNGSVSARMVKPKAASRMTNGTVSQQKGDDKSMTLSVNYGQGTETIQVPSNVTVTEIGPVNATLKVGQRLGVVARKDASGAWVADKVSLPVSAG
jgi:hypothetical protein